MLVGGDGKMPPLQSSIVRFEAWLLKCVDSASGRELGGRVVGCVLKQLFKTGVEWPAVTQSADLPLFLPPDWWRLAATACVSGLHVHMRTLRIGGLVEGSCSAASPSLICSHPAPS